MEKETPRLPEVGEFVRQHGRLIAVEVVPPPPPPPPQKDYIFEEIEARCEIRRNGELFKELHTNNDFYGLETSVKVAIEEMEAMAAQQQIGPESELEIVVVRVTSYFRARPQDKENLYDRKFVDFEPIPRWSRNNVPGETETVVWSSKGIK